MSLQSSVGVSCFLQSLLVYPLGSVRTNYCVVSADPKLQGSSGTPADGQLLQAGQPRWGPEAPIPKVPPAEQPGPAIDGQRRQWPAPEETGGGSQVPRAGAHTQARRGEASAVH